MRALMQVAIALLLLCSLNGCGTASAPQSSSASGGGRTAARQPSWISLERVEGGTSVYLVTLFDDGQVVFEGIVGDRRRTLAKTIPADRAAEVFAKIEAVDFWERAPRYDVERATHGGDSVIVRSASMEAPWEILRAQRHSRFKRIDGLFFAPAELLELKALIERTVGLAEWRGEAGSSP